MSLSIMHMVIRLLQLNIQKGAHLDAVIRYIRNGRFDIVCLQEVAGGRFAHKRGNCYEDVIAQTGLMGQLAVYITVAGDVSSFIGNATFYRHPWALIVNHVVWLKRYQEVPHPTTVDQRRVARCALATTFRSRTRQILVVNTHLAWGPTPNDALYKRNQAEKLHRWIRAHDDIPFVLTGDFNLNPKTEIVSRLGRLGNNLTKQYHISNTLNPRVHYAKNLFPSGLPVDYIITDRRLTIKKFLVEEAADLSDHYGLVAEVTL